MADEEQSQESKTDAAPAKPKKLLLIGIIAGGLILGVLGGVFALGPMLAKKLGGPATASAATASEAGAKSEHGEKGAHGEKTEKASSTVHMMENLVLNPAGSNGTRFLMVAVAAEVADEKVSEQLTARDAEMRDAILRLLGQRTVEQLADMQIREPMKRQLIDSLNARLGSKDAIKRVYFPQFVIQ